MGSIATFPILPRDFEAKKQTQLSLVKDCDTVVYTHIVAWSSSTELIDEHEPSFGDGLMAAPEN